MDVTGSEIALAFSRYLLQSEQVRSAMLISNFLEPDGQIARSGGLLVQAMPGVDEGQLEQMESSLSQLPPFNDVLKEADTPDHVVQLTLPQWEMHQVLKRDLQFACSCSREKVVQVLKSMSDADRAHAVQEDGRITVTCDYCREAYTIEVDEVN